MDKRNFREDTYTEALSVVLQHQAVAADQQNICRIIQVCKAWKTAVQHSNACLTDIKIIRRLFHVYNERIATAAVTEVTAKLVQCARWLSLYPGTVRSISIHCDIQSVFPKLQKIKDLAQHVLIQRMRAASTTATVPASACISSGHSAPAMGAVALRPLQLKMFDCSNFLASAAVVSALPAATLTHLEVSVPEQATTQWRKAFNSLSNLRSLCLVSEESLAAYCSTISKLTTLTRMCLPDMEDATILRSLPQQLRKLSFEYSGDKRIDVSLCYLTQLQQLQAEFFWTSSSYLALPQQLQDLELSYQEDFKLAANSNITFLQQLQHLALQGPIEAPEDLLLLNNMKQLKSLDLCYGTSTHVVAAAPIWPQLQQLVAFRMDFSSSAVDIATAMESVSLLTQLTRLELTVSAQDIDEVPLADVAEHAAFAEISSICKYLKNLKQLKNLLMTISGTEEGHQDDLLHLSVLTGLTRLDLFMQYDLDSSVASAVFLELTNLKCLLVELCDVYALPAIGKLCRLTYLDITGLSQHAQQAGLKFLSQLRNLQELHGFEECSQVEQFWDNLAS